jgi:hypothetical protein
VASHSCPGVPIPSTPHSHTAMPLPSPLISGMGYTNGMKLVLLPYNPAPPIGSPYLYLFKHIHCRQAMVTRTTTLYPLQMDPNSFPYDADLLSQQWWMVSDSTLSSSLMPFLGLQSNPWTYLWMSNAFSGRRGGLAELTVTMCLPCIACSTSPHGQAPFCHIACSPP